MGYTNDKTEIQLVRALDVNNLNNRLPDLKHSLGHCNGVDFINGYFISYNGGGAVPEICLLENINEDTTEFLSENGVNIVFKEANKLFPGDGSVCFGDSEKVMYYSWIIDANNLGIKKSY